MLFLRQNGVKMGEKFKKWLRFGNILFFLGYFLEK